MTKPAKQRAARLNALVGSGVARVNPVHRLPPAGADLTKQRLEALKILREQALQWNSRLQQTRDERLKKEIGQTLQTVINNAAIIRMEMLPAKTANPLKVQRNLQLFKDLESLKAQGKEKTLEFKKKQLELSQRIRIIKKQADTFS